MIEIQDKTNCSGCKACGNACPVNAISFTYDDEGFLYPVIDKELCINCGKCERACPYSDHNGDIANRNLQHEPLFYAAQLKKKSELLSVSSGGAFQAIAKAIISEGGIVYGAKQENVDRIFHFRASNIEELELTKRSKYFQSDMGVCYKAALDDLNSGKTVLFSGTACQIAGLYSFLHKQYEMLYTCEVVCHGVPSKKVWEKYREEKEKKEGKKISELIFRDKTKGWSNNQYRIIYEDGLNECESSSENIFHRGYLMGLFYRPSCGKCRFARLPRVADISLADYWKYSGPMNNDDLGISLVALNSSKGESLFMKAKEYLDIETVSKINALSSCRHLSMAPAENKYRSRFFKEFNKYGYYAAIRKYINKRRFVRRIRKLICKR